MSSHALLIFSNPHSVITLLCVHEGEKEWMPLQIALYPSLKYCIILKALYLRVTVSQTDTQRLETQSVFFPLSGGNSEKNYFN